MITLTKEYQLIEQKYIGAVYGSQAAYLRTYAKYNSNSTDNNTTNVSVQGRIYNEQTWWASSGTYYNITNDGKSTGNTYCNTTSSSKWSQGETVLNTVTKDVKHDDNGSKEINVSTVFCSEPWGFYTTASGTVKLPDIARAATIVCTSPNIGDAVTIQVDSKSDSFTYTLTYNIQDITGTICTKKKLDSSKTVLFATTSIANSLYAKIPNAKEITGTIYCETYNGATKIGETKSTPVTLYTKESDCKPTVNATIVDTNTAVTNITGSNTKFVRYVSKPKVTISATAKKSATIKSYSINLNDGQTSKTNGTTFNTIGSNEITINAIDSRGYSNPTDKPIDMINYVKLQISNLKLTRTEGTSNKVVLNCDGVFYNGNFSSSKTNTLTCQFQYRKSGTTTWSNITTPVPTKSGNTFKWTNVTLGVDFDYNSQYQFRVVVNDLLTSDNRIEGIAQGLEVWWESKHGIGVNGHIWLNNIDIRDVIYPVGSIYMSVNSTSPATLFGGTWQRITGRFLLGAIDGDAKYSAGKTGGEETHTLIIEEMPSHNHTYSKVTGGASYKDTASGSNYGDNPTQTSSTGGGKAHNNMPPFLAVYIWKRTA